MLVVGDGDMALDDLNFGEGLVENGIVFGHVVEIQSA